MNPAECMHVFKHPYNFIQTIYIFIFLFISKSSWCILPFALTEKWHSQAYPSCPWRWTRDRIGGPAMQSCWSLGTGRAEGSEYKLGGEAEALAWGDRRANCSISFTPHISIQAWILPEVPLGDSAHAAPSLIGQSATARWVRSFVRALVFPETQQWCCSFAKQVPPPPPPPAIRLFLCVWFFKESPKIYCNLTVSLATSGCGCPH
jgi:hypothetical protein